ncbi:MAG: hypothetical protein IJX28_07555 [Clostridia bacterium]|nr:hypothetical protein [Clostridia bacterium]
MKKQHRTRRLSPSKWMLHLEFGGLALILGFFLKEYTALRATDPVYANHYYPELAEYIIGAFVIALISALLVHLLELEQEHKTKG